MQSSPILLAEVWEYIAKFAVLIKQVHSAQE